MTRLIIVATAAICLILFVAFVVARLLVSRTRGMSIRMQIFLALGLIVGAFAFGLGLMVIDRIEARAVRLATQAAEDEARALARLTAISMSHSGTSIEQVAAALTDARRHGAEVTIELMGPDGRQLFPEDAPSRKAEPGTVTMSAPIDLGGARVGAVRVIKPTIVMRRLLADFAPTVLVISLVLGAAAALSAAWIGRAIAAPIEALRTFSEEVSAGKRTSTPRRAFGREVMHLLDSVDSMRRQLEGRPFVETFATDLSHELKNPVAAIRASAEILEEGALDEPEEARRFVARIREATERIERLLGELLSLARIEARGAEQVEPVDLSKLVEDVTGTLDDRGRRRIEMRRSGDARVRADGTWLKRAVSNLIENALIHSLPQSRVSLTVSVVDSNVVFEVGSSGEVRKHVRERLFNRFVTTRSDRGGSGLGLAIVRAVAEAHGGEIELTLTGPPDVLFKMTLPRVGFS